jgi:hemerythrin-like domain-containing protein
MLRDKNLIPLSHQHQRALALCVRIDRASPIHDSDLNAWRMEVTHLFETEIKIHFTAEEGVLFPTARKHRELVPLIEELLADHDDLRKFFTWAEAHEMSAPELAEFAEKMSAHIRKEERQLFERMQELMDHDELVGLGNDLRAALKEAAQACILPTEATRLRPKK